MIAVKTVVERYKKMSVPRSILIRVKVCGWVPGAMVFSWQGLSAGVTDPSESSECGSGPASN